MSARSQVPPHERSALTKFHAPSRDAFAVSALLQGPVQNVAGALGPGGSKVWTFAKQVEPPAST
jgi:hypothetical protein